MRMNDHGVVATMSLGMIVRPVAVVMMTTSDGPERADFRPAGPRVELTDALVAMRSTVRLALDETATFDLVPVTDLDADPPTAMGVAATFHGDRDANLTDVPAIASGQADVPPMETVDGARRHEDRDVRGAGTFAAIVAEILVATFVPLAMTAAERHRVAPERDERRLVSRRHVRRHVEQHKRAPRAASALSGFATTRR